MHMSDAPTFMAAAWGKDPGSANSDNQQESQVDIQTTLL